MKKFISLMLVIGLSLSAFSQRFVTIPLAAGDTVNNTGTASKIILATDAYSGVVIKVKATEVGSITSAGTIVIQGGDGTDFETIGSAYTVTDVASQYKYFYISAPVPSHLKVLQTGSGTMQSVLSVKYLFRKYFSK